MATEVVKIVDPNNGAGTDYTSLSAWEAGQQGDLTGVRDEIAVAKCRCTGGTADTTGFTIDGWTTSATQYIKIWTDTAESYRHNGTYQTGNKYRLYVTNSAALTGVEGNIRLDGLQIGFASINNHSQGALNFESDEAADIRVSNCVIKGTGSTDNTHAYHWGIYFRLYTSGSAKIWNNIIYDFQATEASKLALAIGVNIASLTIYAYNNTIQNCYFGLYRANGTFIAKNCGITGCTTPTSGTITQTTCSSSAPTFVDAGADNFHLASDDITWLGQGTNLYNDANYAFQDDIDGDDRGGNGASWDIGADEYVAAAGGLDQSIRMVALGG